MLIGVALGVVIGVVLNSVIRAAWAKYVSPEIAKVESDLKS